MSFFLYLSVVALTYIRVFEAFAPEMVVYRPMLVLSMLALVAALIRAALTQQIAVTPKHLLILTGLIASIGLSVLTNGWMGGALIAVLDFAPTAVLFALTLLNVTSVAKLRTTCAVIVISMLLAAGGSVAGYHLGFLGHRLLITQSAGQDQGEVTQDDSATDEEQAVETEEQPPVDIEDASPGRLVRIRNLGMLSDPNDLAQAIVMVLPLLCLAWRGGSGFRNLMWVILPTTFLLYAIYLTHSRGALVGLSAMILLTFRKRLGSIRTFALVGVLVVAAAVTNLAGSRAYSVNEASAGGRIEVWSVGLEMFRAHPWFGVGYGNFVENSAEYGLTAHNSFVLCLAELGMIGCFFWLALIVSTARELQAAESMPSAGEPEGMQKLIVALRASLIGFLVCALFLSRAYAPHLYLLLGLCSAASYCTFENEEVAPRSASWIPQSAGALAGGIVVIYLAIRLKHALG